MTEYRGAHQTAAALPSPNSARSSLVHQSPRAPCMALSDAGPWGRFGEHRGRCPRPFTRVPHPFDAIAPTASPPTTDNRSTVPFRREGPGGVERRACRSCWNEGLPPIELFRGLRFQLCGANQADEGGLSVRGITVAQGLHESDNGLFLDPSQFEIPHLVNVHVLENLRLRPAV